MPDTSVSPCIPLVPFKLLPWCWSSERVNLSRWACVCSLRGTAWGSRSFFHQLNPCWVLLPEVMGTYLPGPGTLGWGAWCEAETPCCLDIPLGFVSMTRGQGTSPFHICASPTTLDVHGFFNSIVVRLPFNLISNGSEWWLFHILVVILMWLCEEVTMSDYTSILTRSPSTFYFLNLFFNYRQYTILY